MIKAANRKMRFNRLVTKNEKINRIITDNSRIITIKSGDNKYSKTAEISTIPLEAIKISRIGKILKIPIAIKILTFLLSNFMVPALCDSLRILNEF